MEVKTKQTITASFEQIRAKTEEICAPLKTEDFVVQPMENVSPPKWHLAHTTWFFEQFILIRFKKDYKVFDDNFGYLFNSYYNHFGDKLLRPHRGLMTRPTVEQVYEYRKHVNQAMVELLDTDSNPEIEKLLQIGLNHEQQHQELLIYDIKYIFGNQVLFPVYGCEYTTHPEGKPEWIQFKEGIYEIGAKEGFCFDNEQPRHNVYCHASAIRTTLVTNEEYLAFIADKGYERHELWLSEGWEFIKENNIKTPLYWHKKDDLWMIYTLNGLKDLPAKLPVQHISYFEACAFAEWKGMRLPTEFEWELLAEELKWGQLWEWTSSAYQPYPRYKREKGALGEYNGKFMVNQQVLRGCSVATPKGHARKTYRNFFPTDARWIFNGIRLAK